MIKTCLLTNILTNTEPSYKKGEHWLALFFNKSRNCPFFDSYGHDPTYFNILNYIKQFDSPGKSRDPRNFICFQSRRLLKIIK